MMPFPPDRTDTNRRRYTDTEIERLTLLRAATLAGHSIGDVARLPTENCANSRERPAPVIVRAGGFGRRDNDR